MIILKILAIPFKLSAKLMLYAVGGIILAIIYVLTFSISTFKVFIQSLSVLAFILTFLGAALTISRSDIGAPLYIVYGVIMSLEAFTALLPDVLLGVLLKCMDISFLLFRAASFRLF